MIAAALALLALGGPDDTLAASFLPPRSVGSKEYQDVADRVSRMLEESGGKPAEIAPLRFRRTRVTDATLAVGSWSLRGLAVRRPTSNASIRAEAVLVRSLGERPVLPNFRVLANKIVLVSGDLRARSFRNQIFGASPAAVILLAPQTPAPSPELVESLSATPLQPLPQAEALGSRAVPGLQAAGYRGPIDSSGLKPNQAVVHPLKGQWRFEIAVERSPFDVPVPAASFGPPGRPLAVAVALDSTGGAGEALSLAAWWRFASVARSATRPLLLLAVPGAATRTGSTVELVSRWRGELPVACLSLESLAGEGDLLVAAASARPDFALEAAAAAGIRPVLDPRSTRSIAFRFGERGVPAAVMLGPLGPDEEYVPPKQLIPADELRAQSVVAALKRLAGVP